MNLASITGKRFPIGDGDIEISFNGQVIGSLQSISYSTMDSRGVYEIGNRRPSNEDAVERIGTMTYSLGGGAVYINTESGRERLTTEVDE